MDKEDLYRDREQTLVKHFILEKYLERFAHIILSRWNSITYIDGFSGPWQAASSELEDTSFAIALQQLRKAQQTYSDRGRVTRLRCFFVEKNKGAFKRLAAYALAKQSQDQICVRNTSFADSMNEIVSFIKQDQETFSFIFLDPTGWTGFEIGIIRPLLQLQPSEVLINFMTGHIMRFWTSPDSATQRSLEDLYDDPRATLDLQKLPFEERTDAAVQRYCDRLREVGDFKFVCRALILHPTIDKAHFHLVYATRDIRGLEVFKETEKAAMSLQELTRARARQRRAAERTGQPSLFGPEVLDNPRYVEITITRYLDYAKAKLVAFLRNGIKTTYGIIKEQILIEPVVQDGDLKHWLTEWQKQKAIAITMNPRQRVPHDDDTITVLSTAHLA